jgi:hypothetical protein
LQTIQRTADFIKIKNRNCLNKIFGIKKIDRVVCRKELFGFIVGAIPCGCPERSPIQGDRKGRLRVNGSFFGGNALEVG